MNKAEELVLVDAARRGDGDAVAGLIRAHQDGLYAFMLRLSGRPDVAEDIVQEAFVRVLRNLDRFDERFRFSTWVFTIAKRLYVNAMQKHRPVYDTDTLSGARGHGATPSGQSLETERRQQVRDLVDEALEVLNEPQREIILLFHQQGWPIHDIAEYLSMPEGTVKSHLHRARKRMRLHIEADEALAARAEEAWA